MIGVTKMTERIVVDPKVHFGKPCLANTRVPVVSVLELVGEGITFSEIIESYYPDLEVEDIRACVKYAIDLADAEEIHITVAS
jgi:uncharacterized protein (DUF433 family)